MSLKSKLSSWRKQLIEVPRRTCKTVNFFDTKPNMIFVQNNYNFPFFVSLDSIPTTKKFDYKIKSNYGKCVGRPYGTQQFYILNDNDIDMTVPIWSIAEEFDFSILQDFSLEELSLTSENLEALKPDGIIKGFENGVMLPQGTNEIGSVSLSSEDKEILQETSLSGLQIYNTLDDVIGYYEIKLNSTLNQDFLTCNGSLYLLARLICDNKIPNDGSYIDSGDDITSLKKLYEVLVSINNKETKPTVPTETILKTRTQEDLQGVKATKNHIIHIKNFTVYESIVKIEITNGTQISNSLTLDFSDDLKSITDLKISIPEGYFYKVTSGNGSTDDKAIYTLLAEIYEV